MWEKELSGDGQGYKHMIHQVEHKARELQTRVRMSRYEQEDEKRDKNK